jgi:ABC-type multidrug transport system fused ATPase/permease subunit
LKENKSSSIKDLLIGVVLIAIIGYIFIWLLGTLLGYAGSLINKLSQVASNLDVVVIVALITGSVSILGVVISSIVSKIIEYRQNTKRYLYEKKEEPYSEFIEMVYKIQENAKETKEYTEKEMIDDILSFSKKLTLWGSNKVIRKWLAFRKKSQDEDINPTDNLFILEDIIFEIRKDMGQKKRGLKRGDILAFFVNDIKERNK